MFHIFGHFLPSTFDALIQVYPWVCDVTFSFYTNSIIEIVFIVNLSIGYTCIGLGSIETT